MADLCIKNITKHPVLLNCFICVRANEQNVTKLAINSIFDMMKVMIP
jgi:hypothetical protein